MKTILIILLCGLCLPLAAQNKDVCGITDAEMQDVYSRMRANLKALKKVVEFAEKSVLDLGAVATRHGLKQTGVRNLAGLFLGFRIPKGTKTSNWARAQLTPQQIAYAATDAWACRELYQRFRSLGLV